MEDIIALSDAFWYTACPNSFIGEFVKENGKPYDEETDNIRSTLADEVGLGKTIEVGMIIHDHQGTEKPPAYVSGAIVNDIIHIVLIFNYLLE